MSRVTLTTDQFTLFQQSQRQAASGAPRKPGAPRVKKRKQDLPENILEGQIKSFLESHNWECIRLQAGTFAALGILMAELEKGRHITREILYRSMVRIGEKGRADWLAVRPRGEALGVADLLYWEAKAPGKKPEPKQAEWLRHRNAVGYRAAWFDDFDGDWDTSFLPWYRARYE